MLRHARRVHLRISFSVSSWAAVPASCKLSGNWCEIRSSRMKPLPFLCLVSFLVFELVCSLPVQDPHPVSTHLSPNTLHLASSFYHWVFLIRCHFLQEAFCLPQSNWVTFFSSSPSLHPIIPSCCYHKAWHCICLALSFTKLQVGRCYCVQYLVQVLGVDEYLLYNWAI